MTIGRICCRQVDTADPNEPIHAAAQRMGNRDVGSLVVVDAENRATGILTDRDVALRVVGARREPRSTTVADVMTPNVHTVSEEMPIEDALSLMRTEAVRRLVVVDPDGELVGIVSVDDILALLAQELRNVGELLERESPRAALAGS